MNRVAPPSSIEQTVLRIQALTGASQKDCKDRADAEFDQAKLKAKLIDDPVTKAYQINVDTFKGTVQLSGFVDSAEARSRATLLAKDTDGVKDVKNSLQIRKSEG